MRLRNYSLLDSKNEEKNAINLDENVLSFLVNLDDFIKWYNSNYLTADSSEIQSRFDAIYKQFQDISRNDYPALRHDLNNDFLWIRFCIDQSKEIPDDYLRGFKEFFLEDVNYSWADLYKVASEYAVNYWLNLNFYINHWLSKYKISLDRNWKVMERHIWCYGVKEIKQSVVWNLLSMFWIEKTPRYDEIKLLKNIPFDGLPVRRILWNLLKNAKEAWAKTVNVSILYTFSQDIIIVSNDGPSMTVEEIENVLFKKGVSSKGENRGIWMYYLAKDILESDWEIQVISINENMETIEANYAKPYSKITSDNITWLIEKDIIVDEIRFKRYLGTDELFPGVAFVFRAKRRQLTTS